MSVRTTSNLKDKHIQKTRLASLLPFAYRKGNLGHFKATYVEDQQKKTMGAFEQELITQFLFPQSKLTKKVQLDAKISLEIC